MEQRYPKQNSEHNYIKTRLKFYVTVEKTSTSEKSFERAISISSMT